MAGDSSEKSKVPKAYCDTNTLFNKIKEPEELDALEQLLQMRSDGNVELYRSAVVAREVMDTKDQEKRKKLLQDYDALTPIAKDEKVLAIDTQVDHTGSSSVYPIGSDVQDEKMHKELVERGIGFRDAQHITQAVCNGCNVFLTRDRRTITDPHREWLEKRFLRIRTPSELVQEMSPPASR